MMDNEATVLNRVMDGILNKLFVLFHSIAMIRDIAIHYITVIPLYILRLRVKYILGDGHRNLVRKANQRLQQEDVSSRLNSDDTFPNPDVALILNKSNYPFSYSNVTIPERLDPSYICYAEIIPVYSIDYISDVIASLRQYDYKQQRFGK
ncbi:hypothetical protein FOZ62_023016 [Perkinsus olseni]|uniref:Uncharacterized protein n=1 Tax=Perkinsus olseni TaxID=32597 RepID=A0A7J6RCJ2_PEROL|nr:hypothetical protein FOZ62_023016 [Perkinsus olseni]